MAGYMDTPNGGPMTSESARDVLRERVVEAVLLVLLATFPDSEYELDAVAGDIVEALPAVAPELLAVLAEPKACEICQGRGSIPMIPRMEMVEVCSACHGTGSVAVDVLDLLGYEQVGWQSQKFPALMTNDTQWFDEEGRYRWRPVYAAKDGTP